MSDKAQLARLIVHDFPNMSKEERKYLKNWLRRQLSLFEHDEPQVYTQKYTDRLFK